MDRDNVWLELAGDVLTHTDPGGAERLVGEALTRRTHAGLASRVSLSNTDPDAVAIAVTGQLQPPPPERLPSASQIRRHPLHAHYLDTGEQRPTVMRDVLRAGWAMESDVYQTMCDLNLPEEQVSLSLGEPGSAYDGWVLIAEDPFGSQELEELASIRPLLVGLARHCRLLSAAIGTREEADGPRLTPRERIVLLLVAQGRTAEGIASRLAISPRTVHKHQENLYRKLGASDRLSAVLAAQRRGFLREA